MTANIMKANREVVHCSTYYGIKEYGNSNKVHISLMKDFDNSTRGIFGPYISPDDFPDVNLEDIPLYGMCEDDTMDAEGGLADNS